jgi:hypothetical protein
MIAGIAAGLIGIVGAAIAIVALDMEAYLAGRGALLVGLACGAFPGLGVYTLVQRSLRGATLDLVIPWDRLEVREIGGAWFVRAGTDVACGEFVVQSRDSALGALMAQAQSACPPQPADAHWFALLTRWMTRVAPARWAWSALLLLLGALLQVVAWTSNGDEGELAALAAVFALCTFLPGALLMWRALMRVPPIVARLRSAPQDACWIWTLETGSLTRLVVGFTDGRRAKMNLPTDLARAAYAGLARSLPWASTGTSRELVEMFNTNPRALLRAA